MPQPANPASPHAIRVPGGWPAGRTLALAVSILLEGWPEGVAPEGGPSTAHLNKGFADTAAQSWVSYGPKVGAWRILDVLDKAEAKAVFYTSGILSEQYPDLLKEVVARGHVLAAHGWAQNILPIYLNEAEEQDYLTKIRKAFTELTGQETVGYASPRGTPSVNTVELLTRNGYRWTADFRDHDLPYIRLNNTPNHRVLAGKLAAIEGAESALVAASGMSLMSELHGTQTSGPLAVWRI